MSRRLPAELGVPPRRASALAAVAHALTDGALRLEPRSDIEAAKRGLLAIEGIGDPGGALASLAGLRRHAPADG